MSEIGKLPAVERALACRAKAEELAAEVQNATPDAADELRSLSRRYLLLAQQIENGQEEALGG